MKKILFFATSIILSTFLAAPVRATQEPYLPKDIILRAVKYSAITYCNEKDIGTQEEKSLFLAYEKFLTEISTYLSISAQEVHISMQNNNAVKDYWNLFNLYAYNECPEYY